MEEGWGGVFSKPTSRKPPRVDPEGDAEPPKNEDHTGQTPFSIQVARLIWKTTAVWPQFRGLLGILVLLGLAYLLSNNRRAIRRKTVGLGLGMQVVFALLLPRVPPGRLALGQAAEFVDGVLQCALDEAAFLFGPKLVDRTGPAGSVFAFRVLPTVIFVAALFSVLYHRGIMPIIAGAFAWIMARVLGSSGTESLNAASLFLGQTEAPLTIKPYLANFTLSELRVVMTARLGLRALVAATLANLISTCIVGVLI
ncbi:MAG TPA: Na+ dependent nucleoside transporter N-terminal domain-containing protein [Isosphaeraceae bacterium]|nr:Na+ dependent nucleoside transporter N-terminal domain-containing protein [Isosphaeraceae bacterium]